MAEKKKQMKTIELMNGNVLQCEKKKGRRKTWRKPKKPDNYATLMLFVRYAWFLFHNRERIYSDSRLFLAKVPIKVVDDGWYFALDDNRAKWELCKRNDYDQPLQATLGGMLEYWDTNKDTVIRNDVCDFGLIYQYYHHRLIAHVIRPDGTSYRRKYYCHNLINNNTHKTIHERYDDACHIYKAYTLQQVVDLLLKEQRHNQLYELMAQNEQLKLEVRELRFIMNFKESSRRWAHKKAEELKELVTYLRRDAILPFYQQEVEFNRKKAETLEKIEEEIREKKKELINGYTPGAQREYQELLRKRRDEKCWGFYTHKWRQFISMGSCDSPSRMLERIKKYDQLSEEELKSHLFPQLPDPEGNN